MFKREVRLRLGVDNNWHLETRMMFAAWSHIKSYSFDDLDNAKEGGKLILNPKIIEITKDD